MPFVKWLIEHPAQVDTVWISAHDTETDEPSGKDIHDHHYPIALQQNRFTPKEVNASETVFGMTDGRQPGNAIAIGLWPIVLRQDPTHDILVDRDTEGIFNLLGNLPATETWIAAFPQ